MTIAICTPAVEKPEWRYLKSLFILRVPGGFIFKDQPGKQGVDEAHNHLIEWFLYNTKLAWMLMLDSDACLHSLTFQRLMSWDKPLVSALAFGRQGPHIPIVYGKSRTAIDGVSEWLCAIPEVTAWLGKYPELCTLNTPGFLVERPDDALFPVQRTGTHCTLVHRSVLEAIEPPWFKRSGRGAQAGAGSDFYFHEKAFASGVDAFVDLSVVAGHLLGNWCIGALDFLAWHAITDYSGEGMNIVIEGERVEEEELNED